MKVLRDTIHSLALYLEQAFISSKNSKATNPNLKAKMSNKILFKRKIHFKFKYSANNNSLQQNDPKNHNFQN